MYRFPALQSIHYRNHQPAREDVVQPRAAPQLQVRKLSYSSWGNFFKQPNVSSLTWLATSWLQDGHVLQQCGTCQWVPPEVPAQESCGSPPGNRAGLCTSQGASPCLRLGASTMVPPPRFPGEAQHVRLSYRWAHESKKLESWIWISTDLILFLSSTGPCFFLSCPVSVAEFKQWFIDLWNHSIIPYLQEGAKDGIKVNTLTKVSMMPLWLKASLALKLTCNIFHVSGPRTKGSLGGSSRLGQRDAALAQCTAGPVSPLPPTSAQHWPSEWWEEAPQRHTTT